MPQSSNLFPESTFIHRPIRNKILRQQGATVWFTGLSGSGKTSIAKALEQQLLAKGKLTYRLDGDNLRAGIARDLGFSAADRTENIRRSGEICKLFADAGLIVLASFISPYRRDRAWLRELHAEAELPFFEVFVDCRMAVLEQRDTKGLYKKARAGEIAAFTGISDPYEPPSAPELHLCSDELSLQQEVDALMQLLVSASILELVP